MHRMALRIVVAIRARIRILSSCRLCIKFLPDTLDNDRVTRSLQNSVTFCRKPYVRMIEAQGKEKCRGE